MKIYRSNGAFLFELDEAKGRIRDGKFEVENIDLSSRNLEGGIYRDISFTLSEMDSARFVDSHFRNTEFTE